jgi:hypothetical protein
MGEDPETQAAKKAAISTSIHRIHSPRNNQPTNHPSSKNGVQLQQNRHFDR